MKLTSINHLRYYLATNDSVNLSSPQELRQLTQLINSVSAKIEYYCERNFELGTFTEYFQTGNNVLTYNVKHKPINSLISVISDPEGLYQGGEANETNYYIHSSGNGVCLQTPLISNFKGLKVDYTGGIAVYPTVTTLVLANGYGVFTVNKFIRGESSYAFGKIININGANLTIEIYYGSFDSGEQLTQMDSEVQTSSPSVAGVISSFTSRALCELEPDLVLACEMEIRYLKQHRFDFENAITTKDGTTKRELKEKLNAQYWFQPEVLSILEKYKSYSLGV